MVKIAPPNTSKFLGLSRPETLRLYEERNIALVEQLV
jgi:hypothetical protein